MNGLAGIPVVPGGEDVTCWLGGCPRALPPGYTEWPAPAALRDAVACLWTRVISEGAARTALVLPDGCTDLIWEQGRGAFVAGPDTGPVPTSIAAGRVIVGVRFRPSAGGTALGVPLSELRDQRVDRSDLGGSPAARPAGAYRGCRRRSRAQPAPAAPPLPHGRRLRPEDPATGAAVPPVPLPHRRPTGSPRPSRPRGR